ncbi:FKBP-type peptidyl-prolyl cis-trans isomerase [Pedobacter sp. AW1-32]|uniref:FKBP-type peptidyl-prolyl cis-trans isomerase n=1 Tax=Pedobacter sp. AW1-32 TaxID=3383026 RepID=UPI003FF0B3B1
MKNYTLALFSLLISATLFNSCKKEYETIESVDDGKIQAYIAKNNLTMTKDASGAYYQVLEQGTGDLLVNRDSVLFTYTMVGMEDGVTYYTTPSYSNLGTYFGYLGSYYNEAWASAFAGQRHGAKVRMLIPSYLAFGKNGSTTYNIPSNAVLDTYVTTYSTNKQWQIDDQRIQTYLTSKGLSAVKDASRIYYINNTPGTGADVITQSSTVVYKYTARFLDGTVFDSSTDGTYSTTLASVIVGWQKIIPNYKAGAKFRIFIPSDLGYGTGGSVNSTTGATVVPANAVLDFDIEIVSVTN